MEFNAKKALVASLILLLAAIFVKPVFGLVFTFVKTVFEGTSTGKTYGFLLWLVIFFAVLFLKEKKKLPKLFEKKEIAWKKFCKILVIGLVINLLVHSILFLSNANDLTDFSGAIGTMTKIEDRYEWEASYVGHLHGGKIALAPIALALGFSLPIDAGIPLYQITPFGIIPAIILLILLIGVFFYALKEGINNYNGKIDLKLLLWTIISYGLMVVMLDGGFFTVAAQINFGLLVFYYLNYYSNKSFKVWQFFLYPVIALGGGLFILSYVFNILISASYGVSILAILLVSLTLLTHGKEIKHKKAGYALLIFFILMSVDALLLLGFNKILVPGEEVSFFVYGLDPELKENELQNYLSTDFDNLVVKKTGWVGFVKGTPKNLGSLKFVEDSLREKTNAKGYLFTTHLRNGIKSVKISSKEDLSGLKELESEFIKFSFTKEKGQDVVYASTELDRVHTNLFVLNYLNVLNGVKNPVVVTK